MAARMWPQLIILGAIIGSNNLATALAIGACGTVERRWRIVAVFAAFEFTIPLVGLWIGQRASQTVAEYVSWLGPAILIAMGLWITISAFRAKDNAEKLAERVTSWRGLITLSAALSIDNLIVGFSLGLGDIDPLSLATTIGAFAILFAWLGMRVGAYAQAKHRLTTKVGTGLLLIALGLAVATGSF